MNIIQSGGRTVINGREINIPNGSNISIVGNQIYVDGKIYRDEQLEDKKIVQIVITGDVGNITSDCDVSCKNVNGNIKCGRDCEVIGDITGDVIAGRDIECDKVNGSAKAGRDICY